MNQRHITRIRDTAAGLIKSLILARISRESDFLPSHELRRWKIVHVDKDPRPCDRYLDRVKQLHDRFLRDCLTDQDSIPSPNLAEEADELDTLLDLIATFIIGDLSEAARNARDDKKICWTELARWEELDRIRNALDRLPCTVKGTGKRKRHYESDGDPTDVEDGPHSPDGFVFRKKLYRGLNGVAFRLVEVLWVAKGQCINVDTHAESIWEDSNLTHVSPGQLSGARARANRFFVENRLQFRVTVKDDRATLHKEID